jgi:hypothetical protein
MQRDIRPKPLLTILAIAIVNFSHFFVSYDLPELNSIKTGLTVQEKVLKVIIDVVQHLTLISGLLLNMMKMASFQTQDQNRADNTHPNSNLGHKSIALSLAVTILYVMLQSKSFCL